jgi:hypothetical protein
MLKLLIAVELYDIRKESEQWAANNIQLAPSRLFDNAAVQGGWEGRREHAFSTMKHY